MLQGNNAQNNEKEKKIGVFHSSNDTSNFVKTRPAALSSSRARGIKQLFARREDPAVTTPLISLRETTPVFVDSGMHRVKGWGRQQHAETGGGEAGAGGAELVRKTNLTDNSPRGWGEEGAPPLCSRCPPCTQQSNGHLALIDIYVMCPLHRLLTALPILKECYNCTLKILGSVL